MKDKLFEPYYKQGFDHFVFKKLLHLRKPGKETQIFYLTLIAVIISISFLFG